MLAAATSTDSTRLRRGVACAGLFALAYMAMIGIHPFTEVTKAMVEDRGSGNLIEQLWYPLILAILIAIARPFHDPWRAFPLPLSLFVALAWCTLSLSWAYAPAVGLRRLALTAIVIVSIFRAVDELGVVRTIAALRVILLAVLLLNYLFMVISPIAIHRSNEIGAGNLIGAWRGAMAHKNFAGAACAATILAFALGGRGPAWWLRLAVVAAAAFFLVMTQSKTSIGLVALALMCGVFYLGYDPRYRSLLVPLFAIVAAVLAYAGVLRYHQLIAPLYGQTGFSGRVQIWAPMVRFIADHPYSGAGFGSFWDIGAIGPIDNYAKGWAAGVGNGHEGYLDLATQIGLPGLVAVVLAATVIPIGRLLATRHADRSSGALALALLVFCAGHNLTETSLFDRAAIVQIFAMLAAALAYQITRVSGPARRASARTSRAAPPQMAARR